MMPKKSEDLAPVDIEALERAISLARRESSELRQQIDGLLERDGWFAAASLACYHFQRGLIRPRLWQRTPADLDVCDVEKIIAAGDDGLAGDYRCAKLVRKMLAAGLSKFEPDLTLIERAATARRRRADSEPAPVV
jgi:hypothetical protein